MTFLQARNFIVSALEKHIGCPVILSEQIATRPDFPYCYYSVLTPRVSNHAFGLQEVQETADGLLLIRSEPVTATMSFTFCGKNRDTAEGYIFGEDEAVALAEKAHGFFLLDAHCLYTDVGEIVIKSVGSVANRTGFDIEEYIRRYGFDVKFAYIRTDEMTTTIIETPGNPRGDPHS
ncbi:MAG: hypothetical protein OSJ54_06200 [Oscillospiraceae bacterium]|nr:hypothetical protein [Oscillospiraceae bacterium]